MPTSASTLLLDTSAAIPLLNPEHLAHETVRGRVKGATLGLAGHAEFETYSVLTRMPGAKRVSAADALRAIRRAFPATVGFADPPSLLESFAEAGITGGAIYDALVGAAAAQRQLPLLTRDRRAGATYFAVGAAVIYL